MTTTVETGTSDLICRPPSPADAAAVHALICVSAPLEQNSLYAYLLLCSHFSGTSAVVRLGGQPVGFLAAYIRPDAPDVLFVWQVAVARDARRRGLGRQMIRDVLNRERCHQVRFLEATVTADNHASMTLFRSVAETLGAPIATTVAFAPADFGTTTHAAEHLVRIGPFTQAAH